MYPLSTLLTRSLCHIIVLYSVVLKALYGQMNRGLPLAFFFPIAIYFRVPKLTFGGTILACGFEVGDIDEFHYLALSCRGGSIFNKGINHRVEPKYRPIES